MQYLGPKLENRIGADAFPPTALADVTGLSGALAARVQTINGAAPDGAGNVVVAGAEATLLWFFG